MLPDFIPVKKHISKIIISYLEKKIQRDPIIGQIRRQIKHEGDRSIIKTYDGIIDEINYQSLCSEFNIDIDEVIKDGPDAFTKHIDKIANDFIKQESGLMFKKINEITSKIGNVVEGSMKIFGPEKILEVMGKTQINFDENGQPTNLQFYMSPEIFNKIKDEIPKWNRSQKLKKKFDEIIEKKRKEWIDRENNRKLVD